jgi:hypothetical protein
MYNLYLIKNDIANVFFFQTEKECQDFAASVANPKFLISQNDIKINFIQAMYWDSLKKKICFNLDICKEIKKNEFRFLRQNKFDKLDSMYMKALQLNDQDLIKKIIDYKQQLRDVTSIQYPSTETELLNFIPDIFSKVEALLAQN